MESAEDELDATAEEREVCAVALTDGYDVVEVESVLVELGTEAVGAGLDVDAVEEALDSISELIDDDNDEDEDMVDDSEVEELVLVLEVEQEDEHIGTGTSTVTVGELTSTVEICVSTIVVGDAAEASTVEICVWMTVTAVTEAVGVIVMTIVSVESLPAIVWVE